MVTIIRDSVGIHLNVSSADNTPDVFYYSLVNINDVGLSDLLVKNEPVIRVMTSIEPETELYSITLNLERYSFIKFKYETHDYFASIDPFVLQAFSNTGNFCDALNFYIQEMNRIINSELKELKICNENLTAFHSYFLVGKEEVMFYSLIDNEKAYEPQYVGTIKTNNFLLFFQALRDMLLIEKK